LNDFRVKLRLCYRDSAIVIVDKPAGMLVHRSGIDAGETVFLMQTLRDQLGQHVFPVHRLDKPTSGLGDVRPEFSGGACLVTII
jgi:tRNA pseudouridine65 synthase